MGGCRCSYRSCKVRSDGRTHLFHFPVFDKMRCHQWISNAHKPDFLNLKLSQLKNRVICQHHFKDEHFMNFLRDKLKPTAVPTEDGPYCVSNNMDSVGSKELGHPVIRINPEDIENDMLNSLEKKAHFSVKYGEYLTSDVTEMFKTTQPNSDDMINYTSKTANSLIREDSYYTLPINTDDNKYTIDYNKQLLESSNKKSEPISSVFSIEFEDQPQPEASQSQEGNVNTAEYQNNETFKEKVMVKIISDENISKPIKVEGQLQPVRPSMIILKRPLRMLKSEQNTAKLEQGDYEIKPQQNNSIIKPIGNSKSQVLESYNQVDAVPAMSVTPQPIHQMEIEIQPQLTDIHQENLASKENDPSQLGQVLLNCVLQEAEDSQKYGTKAKTNRTNVVTSNKSLLKSKVTPEKLAAIEQKRKFNMKLRDVITSCLNNLDEQTGNVNISQETKKAKKTIPNEEATVPPSSQSNVIAYLESRLQKMEDTLLSKIESNTNRINELKRTVKPTASNKKSVNTQTYSKDMTGRAQKEYLYKEISKFLSPAANIRIYEELFIDSAEVNEEPKPRKTRKRR